MEPELLSFLTPSEVMIQVKPSCKYLHDESDYNRKSEFKIFKQTIPYGHFTWNDQSIRHLEAKKVNLTDLMKCVSENDKIPIIDIDRALKLVKDKGPLEFLGAGEECGFTKKDCVKGVPSALVLRIAQKKGLDLNDLDFVFGQGLEGGRWGCTSL